MRAYDVGGFARLLDIGPVLGRDRLAVVVHYGREFDHLLAEFAAYLFGALPDRVEQCLALSDHLLRRFIGLVNETERDLDGLVATRCDLLVERIMYCNVGSPVLALPVVPVILPCSNYT